jgi:predicted RNase H-like nuclease (RuvC/YqgF family)
MDEINDKIEDNKKETPLSVRVDSYYKDLFLELSEQPGYNRKRLLENMISSYIRKGRAEERQNSLNLENEISLISGSLDDILKVFKTISIKAQDTISSNKGLHDQQIENMKKNIGALEIKIQGLEEERKDLKLQNKELQLNIKDTSEENKRLNDKFTYLYEEFTKTKDAHGVVLNEVYNLRRIEGENFKIVSENKELLANIEDLKRIINRKEKDTEKLRYEYEMLELKRNKEIELLKAQIDGLSGQIADAQKSKQNEFKELEVMIRKEIELKYEKEILELKRGFNDLQMKYIKDIGALK